MPPETWQLRFTKEDAQAYQFSPLGSQIATGFLEQGAGLACGTLEEERRASPALD